MTSSLIVASVVRVPYGEDEEPGMPTFLVKGTWRGGAYEYAVSLEIDGRDAEWEHKGGIDPQNDPDGPGWNAWLDDQVEIYNAIGATDAFKQATAEYYG